MLLGGAVFATVLAFWHYSPKVLLIYEFLIFLVTSSVYAPLFYGDGIFTGIMVSEAFLFYTLTFGTALFIARLIRRRLRVAETFLTAALFLVAMISCGSWIYTAVSGALPSCDVILAIFQTHWQEAFDFLKMQRLRDAIVVSITVLFVFWLCRRLSRTIVRADVPSRPSHPAALILGILLLGYSCVRLIPENRDYYAVNLFKMVSSSLDEFRTYQRTVEKRMARLLAAPTLNAGAGVYVLVIGESEQRGHMSAYGYGRKTTPWLDAMAEKGTALLFKNAYSCHTHTVPALTFALTEKNQYNTIELTDAFSIMDMARAAGFETWWLSNQRRFGLWDTPVSSIGSCSHRQFWVNGNAGTGVSSQRYDQSLVSVMPSQVGGKTLMVIHLLGSHWLYADRYPREFRCFSDGDDRLDSQYDDSVRYTDYVLQQIYEKAKDYPGFRVMLYFSDHGEVPQAGTGHDASKFVWPMARIPFFAIFSEAFERERPDLCENLKKHRDAFWTNDLAFNVLLGLMGFDRRHDEQFDLSSPNYAMKREDLMTLHGKKRIADDPAAKL